MSERRGFCLKQPLEGKPDDPILTFEWPDPDENGEIRCPYCNEVIDIKEGHE